MRLTGFKSLGLEGEVMKDRMNPCKRCREERWRVEVEVEVDVERESLISQQKFFYSLCRKKNEKWRILTRLFFTNLGEWRRGWSLEWTRYELFVTSAVRYARYLQHEEIIGDERRNIDKENRNSHL